MILASRRPTLRRYWRLCTSRYTLLRALEYEAVEGFRFDGVTIDFGGGAKAGYSSLFYLDAPLISINIAPAMQPRIVADLTLPLPLGDASADAVISLNTFEHLGDDDFALAELVRVLKPGGRFLLAVPFLFQIHGSPNDHHRHTAAEWERRFDRLGIPSGAVEIEPLVWDPIATAWGLVEGYGAFWRLHWVGRPLALLPGLLYRRILRLPDYAVAYVIRGRKSG
ncbi:MAG: SAM-dependent methyltransferase [Alphaproteobacteria bacterium]|nr:SAM-dependent methyltransferase [Alphaproteobacteria bacterium]